MNDIKINNFLKEAADFLIKTPNVQITDNLFYSSLMYYDVYEDEDISRYFPDWCEHFKYKTNLDVYHSMQQKAFLQFRNCNSKDNVECFKLYLSLPKENFYESVTMIFDYIEKNKIQTLSKVANCIRSDSVVLRIINKEDAIKVVNFVNQNIKNTKKVNPFLLTCGSVGLAYDGNLSYNATISFFLSEYYKRSKQNNNLNNVSALSFNQFIQEKIQNIFINKSELTDFINTDFYQKNRLRFKKESDCIANYYRIVMLISETLKPDMTYDKYFDYVELCQKNNKTKDLENYFENTMNVRENNINIKNILDEYIIYAMDKYGKDNVHLYIESYIGGNISAITREHNFRSKFSKYLTPNTIKKLVNGNVNEYINSLYNIHINDNLLEKINLLYDTCLATTQKYNSEQTYCALKEAIKGNYNGFTNGDNKYRTRLISKIKPTEIEELCRKYMMISEYEITEDDIFRQYCNIIIEEFKELQTNHQR